MPVASSRRSAGPIPSDNRFAASAISNNRLIVIASDQSSIAMVMTIAEENGYDVHIAAHALDFVNALDAFDPAVIVLDIVMPEVDGVELIGLLADRGSRARIILLSDHEHYARLARSLGEAWGLWLGGTLAKPIQLADLKGALSEPRS